VLFEADVRLLYGSVRVAEAVFRAVCPDNVPVPRGLVVESVRCGRCVVTRVVCEGGLLTFLGTVDDFLSAVSVAERSVSVVEK